MPGPLGATPEFPHLHYLEEDDDQIAVLAVNLIRQFTAGNGALGVPARLLHAAASTLTDMVPKVAPHLRAFMHDCASRMKAWADDTTELEASRARWEAMGEAFKQLARDAGVTIMVTTELADDALLARLVECGCDENRAQMLVKARDHPKVYEEINGYWLDPSRNL